jgi:hypothetical protein
MTIEERREWSRYFEQLDTSKLYEIELEKRIIAEERERIQLEISREL